MQTNYNNIPKDSQGSSSDSTVKFFDSYYQVPIEINGTSYTAIKGFFETKGFNAVSAESVASIILIQSKKDGLNPFDIIDTLTGFTDVEISALVGEILNYNRLKTSWLGITTVLTPANEIQRNILA
jgi:hypothetical protein